MRRGHLPAQAGAGRVSQVPRTHLPARARRHRLPPLQPWQRAGKPEDHLHPLASLLRCRAWRGPDARVQTCSHFMRRMCSKCSQHQGSSRPPPATRPTPPAPPSRPAPILQRARHGAAAQQGCQQCVLLLRLRLLAEPARPDSLPPLPCWHRNHGPGRQVCCRLQALPGRCEVVLLLLDLLGILVVAILLLDLLCVIMWPPSCTSRRLHAGNA